MASLASLVLVLCHLLPSVEPAVQNLTIGYLVPWHSEEWPIGPLVGSAIMRAIREVEDRGLLPDYNIIWRMADTQCKVSGFKAALELWQQTANLSMILGPGCSIVCEPVSLMTAYWNLPTVSYSCASGALSDKDVYPTFSRTCSTYVGYGPMVAEVVEAFGWNRVALLLTTEAVYRYLAEAAKEELEARGKTVIFRTLETTMEGTMVNMEAIERQRIVVRALKNEARILFIIAYAQEVRNILISCYDEGMMNGDYMFFGIELTLGPFLSSTYKPDYDQFIWEGFVTITPKQISGPLWEEFAQDVIDDFQVPVWNDWPRLPANTSTEDVDPYAVRIVDAVLMWAYAVNETLQSGGSPVDGLTITQNALNKTVDGLLGPIVVDENGDRKSDQSLVIFQNGEFFTLMHWFAKNDSLVVLPVHYHNGEWHGITWTGGGLQPPVDGPPCGWGERCSSGNLWTDATTGALVSALLCALLTTTGLVLLYRKHRATVALADAASCRASWQDIRDLLHQDAARMAAEFSTFSLQRQTRDDYNAFPGILRNNEVLDERNGSQTDKRLVLFKDRQAMIHHCLYPFESLKEHVLLSRLVKLRSLVHENVNLITAVIPDPMHRYVVTDVSTKGSLFEILDKKLIHMTDDFKLSLLSDIAKGMKYLHQSDIGPHGRLSSRCCVLDSRWVCRVSEYWDNIITSSDELHEASSKVGRHSMEMLWTAPEVLRGGSPTLHSDSYSYGIITQEIITGNRPYALNIPHLDADEVIKRLVNPVRDHISVEPDKVYRPAIPELRWPIKWIQLASSCWNEIPDQRPPFQRILGMVYELNGGRDIKLIDSIALRLESHTRHLEDVVNERSMEIAEEQLRLETLVCELLPKSVYSQLTTGGQVSPETFDDITVAFSDIVSFTKISSLATPMEIVNLLNQLYSMMDSLLLEYDVYKVATIGDSYMIASGLPRRNQGVHVTEIAAMGLAMLHNIRDFRIPHMGGELLHMRMGMHTGPCVAAVTGVKMPRYLLFGETVNMASKIEAAGESMKIHVSDVSARKLRASGRFLLEPRGDVSIPGAASMSTWWLLGMRRNIVKALEQNPGL